MMDKFYKVVRRIGGCLYSFNNYSNPIYSVEYRPHIKTFPLLSTSKLFVFKSLDLAFEFCLKHEIWECEVNNPVYLNVRAYHENEIVPFWSGGMISFYVSPTPLGTYCCDSLTLTKQIFHP